VREAWLVRWEGHDAVRDRLVARHAMSAIEMHRSTDVRRIFGGSRTVVPKNFPPPLPSPPLPSPPLPSPRTTQDATAAYPAAAACMEHAWTRHPWGWWARGSSPAGVLAATGRSLSASSAPRPGPVSSHRPELRVGADDPALSWTAGSPSPAMPYSASSRYLLRGLLRVEGTGGGATGPFAPTRQKLGGGVSSPCGQFHFAAC
jgi:hypothetical protein